MYPTSPPLRPIGLHRGSLDQHPGTARPGLEVEIGGVWGRARGSLIPLALLPEVTYSQGPQISCRVTKCHEFSSLQNNAHLLYHGFRES